MNKSIKKNALFSIILTSANFLFPLIIYSFVSRTLTPEYVGKVSFSNSVITFFSYLAILGIPTYGLRQCSIVKNNKEELSKTVIELLTISLIATTISYLLLFVGIIFIPILKEYNRLLSVMSIYILFNAIGVEWFYKAMEEYSYITIRSIICKLITLILIFLLIKSPDDYILYGFLSILALSANYLCNILHLHSYISLKKYKLDLKRHLKPIFVLFGASIVITIYNNFDVIMIRLLNTDFEVGLYNTALKVKTALISVSTAITAVLIPRITYFLNNNQKDNAKRLLLKSGIVSFIVTIPLCIFITIFSNDIILIFCGADYLKSVPVMRALLFSVIFCSFTNIFGNQILIPLKKENRFTTSVFIGLIINMFLNLLLIPKFGGAGAAIATVFTELWNVLYMMSYTKEYAKYIISNLNYVKYFMSYIISSSLVLFIYKFLPFVRFINLSIVGIIFFTTLYITLIIMKEPLINEMKDLLIKKIFKKKSI